jgi:ferredoxin-NADP reductase
MAVRSFETTVFEKIQLTDKVFYYKLAIPEGFSFLAGQFLSIVVAKNIRRSYSIATPPNDKSHLGLLVDIAPGGPGSQFFVELDVGMSLQSLGPLGNFIYHPEEQRELYLYATGTGIAPLWSMLLEALEIHNTQRQIKLKLGFRFEHDLFYIDELNQLKQKYPNFDYELFMSRPESTWTGRQGYINQDIANLPHGHIDAYICGGTKMILDTQQQLLAKGVPASQIYFEKYY